MMTYPAPPRPGGPDQPPMLARYTRPSRRNGAAVASLVCAILWPLILFGYLLWNSRNCTTTGTITACTATEATAMPAWFSTTVSFLLYLLPPAGIISGTLGLVRSFTRPQLHGRWLAVVGLLVGLLWLVATPFL